MTSPPLCIPAMIAIAMGLASAPGEAQLVVDTIAGGASEEGMLASTSHVQPGAVAACPDGTVYFASSYRIYSVGADGILHVIAGDGTSRVSGDGGPAAKAQFLFAGALTCDSKGQLYFADNHRVRRIDRAGIIRTIAGNGLPQSSATEGEALSVPVGEVNGLAVDTDGRVFLCAEDLGLGGRVSVIRTDGTISLYAGASGATNQDDGDNEPATTAHLKYAEGLALDSGHNLFILDRGRVRKVSAIGIITTPIGSNIPGTLIDGMDASKAHFDFLAAIAITPADDLLLSSTFFSEVYSYRVTPDNKIYQLTDPTSQILAVDGSGGLYFAASSSNARLIRMTPDGSKSIFAGGATTMDPDGEPAKESAVYPIAIAVDAEGRVVFSDAICRLRRINAEGILETIAGTGACGVPTPGVPATSTKILTATRLAVGSDGSIFMLANGSIYKIDSKSNALQTLGTGGPAITVDRDGNLYRIQGNQIQKTTPSGTNSMVLNPSLFLSTSGRYLAVAFDPVTGSVGAFDNHGYVFMISPSGSISQDYSPCGTSFGDLAIASDGAVWCSFSDGLSRHKNGTGVKFGTWWGFSGDGDSIASARCSAGALAAAPHGDIYFVDSYNRIRRVHGNLPLKAPSIPAGGIVNSASYSSTSFSPGQLISIFGDGLALDTRIATTENNQLPLALGSTAVLVDNISLPLLMVSPGQVNAILPKAWSQSSMQIRVTVDGVVSNTITIPISAGAPALFTADASGKGPGAIVNEDGTINSAFQPAPAGTIVSLYGTGAGTMAPQLDSGYLNLSAPFGTILGTMSASVAGQSAEVLYSGGAPILVSGALQMNIRIPAGAGKGAVPVDVSIGSVPANEVTVWVR